MVKLGLFIRLLKCHYLLLFYDYWKIQRNETIEQICAGMTYLYDHDLSHNNLNLRTIFMIQSDAGDRPVIGGFDRLCKMSLAIDASCLARVIISGKFPKSHWSLDLSEREALTF